MDKIVLASFLFLTVAVPAVAAMDPRPRLALRKAVLWTAAATLSYVLALIFLYPRLIS